MQTFWERLKAFPEIYLDWRRRARLRGYLARMTDHELMDIGLSRGEAQREANLPVWRRMELRRRRV